MNENGPLVLLRLYGSSLLSGEMARQSIPVMREYIKSVSGMLFFFFTKARCNRLLPKIVDLRLPQPFFQEYSKPKQGKNCQKLHSTLNIVVRVFLGGQAKILNYHLLPYFSGCLHQGE